jgi:hypothetical protein
VAFTVAVTVDAGFGVAVAVAVAAGFGVAVGFAVVVAVGLGVAVAAGAFVGEGVAVADFAAVDEAVGAGVGLTVPADDPAPLESDPDTGAPVAAWAAVGNRRHPLTTAAVRRAPPRRVLRKADCLLEFCTVFLPSFDERGARRLRATARAHTRSPPARVVIPERR